MCDLQVLGQQPVVEGGVPSKGQADSQVGVTVCVGTHAGLRMCKVSSLSFTSGSSPPIWLAAKLLLRRSAEAAEVLQDVLPTYLIDGQEPELCAESWAILAHSPKMDRYKEFLKDRYAAPLHFMPTWELEELLRLWPWAVTSPALDQETVRVCTAPQQGQGLAKACRIVTHAADACPA